MHSQTYVSSWCVGVRKWPRQIADWKSVAGGGCVRWKEMSSRNDTPLRVEMWLSQERFTMDERVDEESEYEKRQPYPEENFSGDGRKTDYESCSSRRKTWMSFT